MACTSPPTLQAGGHAWLRRHASTVLEHASTTEAPELGSSCNAGVDLGADQEHCGYPCGGDWTIIGCVAQNDFEPEGSSVSQEGQWEGDGVCGLGPGGAGGVGGAAP